MPSRAYTATLSMGESLRNGPLLERSLILSGVASAISLALISTAKVLPEFLVIGGLAAPWIVYAALRYPGALFVAFIFVRMYGGVFLGVSGVSINWLLGPLCIVATIPLVASARRGISTQSVLLPALSWVGLMALVAVGVLYSPAQDLAQTRTIDFFLVTFLPCLLALRVAIEPKLQRQFLVSAVMLSAAIIVGGVILLPNYVQVGRLSVFGANPISTAQGALIIPLVGLSVARGWSPIYRLIVVLLIPLGILVAIASGSRGPILAAVLSFVLSHIILKRNVGKGLTLGAALIGTTVLFLQSPLAYAVLPVKAVERLGSLFQFASGGAEDTTTVQRVELYSLAWDMFIQQPITGFGTSGFQSVGPTVVDLKASTNPHNIFLEFAADYGLLGLILYSLMLVIACRRMIGNAKSEDGQIMVTIGVYFFLNTFTGSGIFTTVWIWGLLLLLMALPAACARGARMTSSGASSASG